MAHHNTTGQAWGTNGIRIFIEKWICDPPQKLAP